MTRHRPTRPSGTPDALASALRACRFAFVTVGLFSLAMNALILAMPLYMLQVYDRVLTTGRYETLMLLTVMAVAALVAMGILDALRSALLVRTGRWLTARLGPVLLASSVRARLMGDEAGAQPLRDLAQVQAFVGGQPMTFLFDLPLAPLFVALVWLLHPQLGTLATGAAVLLFALSLANDLLTRTPTARASLAQVAATTQAEIAIRNAEVVRAMGMLPAVVQRWGISHDAALAATQVAAERGTTILGAAKALRMLVQVGVLGLGALLVLEGELTAGSMIAASILLGRALAPVEQALQAWKLFSNARLAYARLKLRLAAMPPEPTCARLPRPRGRLAVEGLSYVRPGTNRYVLRQISFKLEPGEVLAVVGPSAAGKSTLARMLVGLVPPGSGQVRLDGAALGHWNVDELGRHIGYLPQDVELFPGTVRDNISRLGQDGGDEAVIEAALLAHAHEMILRLPEGYNTQIGDAGARLSGGQRQRIGLARAVYGAPALIVLDEPNANLDQAGEAALAAAVGELKQRGSTMVIIGHRPSTLMNADQILLLKEGRVELLGPRDEVLQKLRKRSVGAVPAGRIQPPAGAAVAAPPVPQGG